MASVEEVRAYTQVVGRISDYFSLVSFCPIVVRLRFSLTARFEAAQSKREKENGGKPDEKEEANHKPPQSDPVPDTLWPDVPLGLLSTLLFLASQGIHCSNFLQAQVFKVKGKGKGLLAALVTGVLNSQKKLKPDMGFMERLALRVTEVLGSKESFLGAHGIMMFVCLGIILVSILFRIIRASYSSPKGFRRAMAALFKVLVLIIVLPVIFAPVIKQEALSTVWTAITSENCLASLRVPLRVLALVFATPLRDGSKDRDKGTPAFFAVFQAASLATSLSELVTDQELSQSAEAFVKEPSFSTLWSSPRLISLLPILIGLVWISLCAMRKNVQNLTIIAGISCACSPVLLAKMWPKAIGWTGKGSAISVLGILGGTKRPEELLNKCLSMVYAFTAASVFFSAGTVGLMVAMFVLQGLTYLHGEDLMKAFGQMP